MEKKRDMTKHVTFVGALHIGFGILSIIGAVALYFFFNFAQSFVTDVDVAGTVFDLIKIFVPVLVTLGGVLGIVGGIGLFSYKQWARILVIVLSALDCLHIPIGTAKGVYSIWALLQDDTIKLFNEKAGVVPIN
jgi:polyferredoxin